MKTISILCVAVVSLVASGCKKQDRPEGSPDHAVAVAGGGAADSGPRPAGSGGGVRDSGADAAQVASGGAAGLPPECNEYKAAIDRLATCDKFPKEARDALRNAYDSASADWASLPAEGKAALKESCRGGADGITTAAKATCGW